MKFRLFSPLPHGVRNDIMGGGEFGTNRGNRQHKGVDYLAPQPGENVKSPCFGTVRRIGRCYADTAEYKLVEIDAGPALVRVLYVDPEVFVGEVVNEGETIGAAQNIAARYGGGMKNHVHLEVRLTKGCLVGKGRRPTESVWIDPEMLL